MFRKFSVLFGLTETELKVLVFLTATFLLGFSYKVFFLTDEDIAQKTFDYSNEDSLFFAAGNDPDQQPDEMNQEDIPVDYKQEVLDFNASNFSGNNTKVTPVENSINLNSAKLEDLTSLPGIGLKTAERIIELRNKRGKFKSLKELLDIKGIGETKFQNITKYLYIE